MHRVNGFGRRWAWRVKILERRAYSGFLASIRSFITKNTWDSIVGGGGDNGLDGSDPNLCLHVHFMYFLFR